MAKQFLLLLNPSLFSPNIQRSLSPSILHLSLCSTLTQNPFCSFCRSKIIITVTTCTLSSWYDSDKQVYLKRPLRMSARTPWDRGWWHAEEDDGDTDWRFRKERKPHFLADPEDESLWSYVPGLHRQCRQWCVPSGSEAVIVKWGLMKKLYRHQFVRNKPWY